LEKTPAAALPTPSEKVQPAGSGTTGATAQDKARSLWPLSLHDIEAFFARIVRPTEQKPAPVAQQPTEKSAAEQPK
jgi:hypothetical protein